jgi:hypothetical protein
MLEFMEGHYSNMSLDTKSYIGARWGKMLIRNIWNTVLKLWQQRNEFIHGRTITAEQDTMRQRLAARIQKYYEFQDQLDKSDRDKIFYTDMESMIAEDIRNIKTWLKLAHRIIKTVKHERQKSKNSRKLMETYFQWKPQTRHSRARQAKPTRSPADTHPD